MNKTARMAMFLVVLTATFSFASGYAFRAGFSLYDYSSGEKEMDKYVKMGYGFGGGLVTTVPLNSKLNFVSEFNFLYRKPVIAEIPLEELGIPMSGNVESYLTEFAISIPVMFQLNLAEGMPYLVAGAQLDTPFSSKMTAKVSGIPEESEDYEDRVSIDFGLVLGVGYLMTPNIGVDVRAVIGLTAPSKGADDESWNQYGLGLTYYF